MNRARVVIGVPVLDFLIDLGRCVAAMEERARAQRVPFPGTFAFSEHEYRRIAPERRRAPEPKYKVSASRKAELADRSRTFD